VAGFLGLYNGSYNGALANWKLLLHGDFLGTLNGGAKSNATAALAQLFGTLPGLPGTISQVGNTAQWSFTPPSAAGTVAVQGGWAANGPTFPGQATNLKFNNRPVLLNFGGGFVPRPDPLGCNAGLKLKLLTAGISVQPELNFARIGNSYEFKLLPLGQAAAGSFNVKFAPSIQVTLMPAAITPIVESWVLPLIASAMVEAAGQ